MTQPPPSGPWGPQPGQPHGQQPGQWPQGQGYPGGPGQFGPPQQQWPAPVPPKKGGAGKWILGAVALVAVIAVTAVVAVSCSKGDGNSGGGGGTAAPNKSGIASANDTGPVGIITEDPSCAPWVPVATTLSNAQSNGWDKRDPSIPATAWTPEQQSQYQAVGQALRSAADQMVPLAKLTTHRVMRELYEQYIAYARAYADSLSGYTANDGALIDVGSSIGAVLNGICGAISYGAAAARSPLVSAAPAPTQVARLGDPANPERFMPTADSQCADWKAAITEISSNPAFAQWSSADASAPASSWTDQTRAAYQAVIPIIDSFSDTYQKLGAQSTNPFISDLGVLAAQYGRAFVAAVPTYSKSDLYIYKVFGQSPAIVKAACIALESK